MTTHSDSRRSFLHFSLGALTGAGGVGALWWMQPARGPSYQAPTGLGPAADAVLATLEGTEAVAQWAIQEHAALRVPVSVLVEQLRTRLGLTATEQPDAQTFTNALRASIRGDFDRGELLVVHRWQLSHTEVLTAVLHLHLMGGAAPPASAHPETEAVKGQIAAITEWGPKSTSVGKPANEQAGGYSAFWFHGENIPRWAQIALAGERLETVHRSGLVIAQLKGEVQKKILSKPGKHPFTLHDDKNGAWQTIGMFMVKPAPGSPAANAAPGLCEVTNWGPRTSVAGTVANPQHDGSMGLWIDVACAPKRVQVQFGNHVSTGNFRGHVVTTLIPADQLKQAGRYPLTLINADTGERLEVGEFVVSEHP